MQRTKSSRYSTVAIPRKLWKEIDRVVRMSGAYSNEAEFVREAIREKLQKVAVVEANDISQPELQKQIIRYIKEKGKAHPSDMAADLGVPYFSVTGVINKLFEEGMLEQASEE